MLEYNGIGEVFKLNTFVEIVLQGFAFGKDATKMYDLSIRANELLRTSPIKETREAMATKSGWDGEFLKHRLEYSQKLEAFAKEQENTNFEYLFSLAVIRLWTILETDVENTVLAEISNDQVEHDRETLRRLRGPLIEFSEASEDQRQDFIFTALKEHLKSDFKPGIAKFEVLLKPFGLAGMVKEGPQKVLLELSYLRNLIVHKDGIVDRQFQKACPWLHLKVGQKHIVSHSHYQRYSLAVMWYFITLHIRLLTRNNNPQLHEQYGVTIIELEDDYARRLTDTFMLDSSTINATASS